MMFRNKTKRKIGWQKEQRHTCSKEPNSLGRDGSCSCQCNSPLERISFIDSFRCKKSLAKPLFGLGFALTEAISLFHDGLFHSILLFISCIFLFVFALQSAFDFVFHSKSRKRKRGTENSLLCKSIHRSLQKWKWTHCDCEKSQTIWIPMGTHFPRPSESRNSCQTQRKKKKREQKHTTNLIGGCKQQTKGADKNRTYSIRSHPRMDFLLPIR